MQAERQRPISGRIACCCLAVFFVFLTGCVTMQTDDFVVARIGIGDSAKSLAARYLGDPALARVIEEFNGDKGLSLGQQIVIPLNYAGGGVRANGYQIVPVLAYHGFSRKKSTKKMVVSEHDFSEQMRFLKENGYTVVGLDRLYDFIELKIPLPRKSVVITIDDGWCSLYEIAFPILKKYKYPATLFLYTDLVQNRNCLNWNQLRQMVDQGLDVQCHTKSHRNLSEMAKDETFRQYFATVRDEIEGAEQLILQELGIKCRYAAYPYGAQNELIVSYLKKRGYRGAVTVERGGNPFFANPFLVQRSVIYGNYGIRQFAANLAVFKERNLQ